MWEEEGRGRFGCFCSASNPAPAAGLQRWAPHHTHPMVDGGGGLDGLDSPPSIAPVKWKHLVSADKRIMRLAQHNATHCVKGQDLTRHPLTSHPPTLPLVDLRWSDWWSDRTLAGALMLLHIYSCTWGVEIQDQLGKVLTLGVQSC